MASRFVFLSGVIAFALVGPVALAAPQETAAPSQEEPPPILSHTPLSCMSTEGYPEFAADVPGDPQNVRVFFRSNISTTFYFVEMTKVEGQWEGIIPKPELPPTESVTYYIEAVDKSSNVLRTGEYSPRVYESCDEDKLVGAVPNITVGATEAGVATVPAGFSAEGLVGFVNLAAAGSEQIAAAAGLGAKAIAGLVGAAAAGTTLVAAAATGDESPSTPQSNPQNPK